MTVPKKRRILFVHHFSGMGGATMSLFYIVERLDPTLFEVEVLFLGGEGDGVEYFRKRGVKVRLMNGVPIYPHAYGASMSFISRKPWVPLSRLLSVNKAAKMLIPFFRAEQYDIVHLNTSLLLAVGKAAKLAGSKVVWHVRESIHKGNIGFRRMLVRQWIKRYADEILTITGFEKQNLGNPPNATVVYNYVDFKKFDRSIKGTEIRKEFQIESSDFVVCNLGGAVHSKGADVFVKAAMLLCKRYSDIKFLIVGIVGARINSSKNFKHKIKKAFGLKRDLSQDIRKLIQDFDLDGKVIITGVRTDVPQLLASSDVLAWTATVKHFARPILEAAAMAKPVVAADFPNTYEALIPDVSGIVFKPGDEHDLANKIETLYLNKSRLEVMGEAGYQLAVQKFNAENNFKLILDTYNRLIPS